MSTRRGREPLWRWPELCRALGIPEVEGPEIHGISIDSRTLQPGELFIALTGDPGERFQPAQRSGRDGHDFIGAALERGAAGIMSHDSERRSCAELKVPDTLDGLWALGRAARARLGCPVVAITGSSGKTTTKNLLAAALGGFASPASLNNHLGVPLSLALTPRNATAAIYEIGTNHPGEIGPLSELARPDVAVLLNVHPAHIGNFPDMDALQKEKLSIINGLQGKPVLVVEDRVPLKGLPGAVRTLTFGHSETADVRIVALDGPRARYRIGGAELDAQVPGASAHRALCLAAVLAVCQVLERPLEPALALDDELVPQGRGNRVQAGGITVVDDSYNANPASMRAALELLTAGEGRKYALIGEMLELGEGSAACHAGLAAACEPLDGVFCVGEGTRPLAAELGDRCLHWSAAADESLLATLRATLQAGDTLLVKGSNRVFWAKRFVAQLLERLEARE